MNPIDNDIVFTRYLYVKSGIPYTLQQTLNEKRNLEESIFWAYEMYFSGFEGEIMLFLVSIYIPYYFNDSSPPLVKYSEKKYKEWKQGNDESILASLLKNIIYVYKSPAAKRFTSLKKEEYEKLVEPCRNATNPVIPPNNILAKKCLYGIIYKSYPSDDRYDELLSAFRENWLYYASETPIWLERITQYKGKICRDEKRVIFPDENVEDEFYEVFGYEPDEQNFTIYEKCLGIRYFQD